MKPTYWIPLSSVLFCVTCAPSDEQCGSDLTAHLDDMERLCTGIFEGTIQNASDRTDFADHQPCTHDSKTYRLEIEATSGLTCTGSEDEQGVDCTHADSGHVELTGTLEIGGDFRLDVTGSAVVGPSCGASSGLLACNYLLPDDPAPLVRFRTEPEAMNPDHEGLEMFAWSRRHSDNDNEPTIWEVCELPIETHE